MSPEATTLLCGGVAGVVGWATVYPLDVVKTMVQVQAVGGGSTESQGLLGRPSAAEAMRETLSSRYGAKTVLGAWKCAEKAYRDGGMKVFWNGIWLCLGRAFIVSAAFLPPWGLIEVY